MKRWILFAAAAAAAMLLRPSGERDISGLLPVELIYVGSVGGSVRVEADTGDFGVGADLDAALADMKAAASGEIFLETADYLIVTKETSRLLPQLEKFLRPATEVCMGIGADAQAAKFLSAHKPGVTLNDLRSGRQSLPVLIRIGERYHLEEGKN